MLFMPLPPQGGGAASWATIKTAYAVLIIFMDRKLINFFKEIDSSLQPPAGLDRLKPYGTIFLAPIGSSHYGT